MKPTAPRPISAKTAPNPGDLVVSVGTGTVGVGGITVGGAVTIGVGAVTIGVTDGVGVPKGATVVVTGAPLVTTVNNAVPVAS